MSERAFQVEEIKRGSQKEYVVQEVFSMFSLSAKGEGMKGLWHATSTWKPLHEEYFMAW